MDGILDPPLDVRRDEGLVEGTPHIRDILLSHQFSAEDGCDHNAGHQQQRQSAEENWRERWQPRSSDCLILVDI